MADRTHSRNYFLGEETGSQTRYELFDALYQPGTAERFGALNLPTDVNILEIGCGIGDTACYLAREIAPNGHVVAFDQAPELVTLAEQRAADAGLSNVTFACARAEAFDYPTESFDVAHSRYVLSYSPHAREIVAQVYDALKPGGIFVGEEIQQSYVRHAQPRWFNDQISWFTQLIEKGGGNPNYGLDALPGDLLDAGFADLQAFGFWPIQHQDQIRTMLRISLDNEMKQHLVDAGIATAAQVDQNVIDMADSDSTGLISAALAVQIVARKP